MSNGSPVLTSRTPYAFWNTTESPWTTATPRPGTCQSRTPCATYLSKSAAGCAAAEPHAVTTARRVHVFVHIVYTTILRTQLAHQPIGDHADHIRLHEQRRRQLGVSTRKPVAIRHEQVIHPGDDPRRHVGVSR